MTTIKEINEYMESVAPKNLSETWDNDGVMVCGDCGQEVKKVLVCLEINLEAIKTAIETGANLIITHHPFIFKPLGRIEGEYFSEIELLIKKDISVLSYHTRYDKAEGGVNDILAKALGLSDISQNGDFLRVGNLPKEMSGKEFAQYLKEKLGISTMKAYFEENAAIKRVSLCGGAGKDFVYDAAQISDAYVSSDFSHNTFIDAKNMGLAIFDAGHYSTENPAAKSLCEKLSEEFSGVSFTFYDVGCPFFVI